MTALKIATILAVALAAISGSARAQTTIILPDNAPATAPAAGKTNQMNVNFSLQISLTGTETATQQAELQQGRRMFYSLAESECVAILDTIGATCSIDSMNVQTPMFPRMANQAGSISNIIGTVTYKVGLKPAKN